MKMFKSHTLLKLINSYVIDLPQPSNLGYMWNFGSLLGFCLVIQIIIGVTLATHYVLIIGAVFALYSAWYFWIPKILGLNYNQYLSLVHFWILFIGVNITFFPQHFLGLQGIHRRISNYLDAFAGWNLISSFGSIISVVATFLFLQIVYSQLVEASSTSRYIWGTPGFSTDLLMFLSSRSYPSLEWALNSPPKPHAFVSLPLQSTWPALLDAARDLDSLGQNLTSLFDHMHNLHYKLIFVPTPETNFRVDVFVKHHYDGFLLDISPAEQNRIRDEFLAVRDQYKGCVDDINYLSRVEYRMPQADKQFFRQGPLRDIKSCLYKLNDNVTIFGAMEASGFKLGTPVVRSWNPLTLLQLSTN